MIGSYAVSLLITTMKHRENNYLVVHVKRALKENKESREKIEMKTNKNIFIYFFLNQKNFSRASLISLLYIGKNKKE